MSNFARSRVARTKTSCVVQKEVLVVRLILPLVVATAQVAALDEGEDASIQEARYWLRCPT